MSSKKAITLISILLIYINSHSQIQQSLSEALKIASQQRMLAQRMAKNKNYIKGNIRTEKIKEELKKATDEFEYGTQYLRDFAPSKEIKHKVDIMEYSFRTYKKAILNNSKNSFEDTYKNNTLFLSICTDVVNSLIEYSKIKNLTITNKNQNYIIKNKFEASNNVGKLTYLSQRLNLYYSFHDFKIKKTSSKEIEEIANEIEKILNYLTSREFNTIDIDDSLSHILIDWSQLRKKLYTNDRISLKSANISSTYFFDTCNNISNRAEKTYILYTK